LLEEVKECFVIMPISDPDDYCSGHFKRVYDDIFTPAIKAAGFTPYRADQDVASNLIQLEILRKLIDCPMAICDLSTRNPNVMFELGIRQAFDKPVTLVQEEGTPAIFDISQFRYITYRKERIYHEVLADQRTIAESIKSTYAASTDGKAVNSIIRLLELIGPAKLDETKGSVDPAVQYLLQEIVALRSEFRSAVRKNHGYNSASHILRIDNRKNNKANPKYKEIQEYIVGCYNSVQTCIDSGEEIPPRLKERVKQVRHLLIQADCENDDSYSDLVDDVCALESYCANKRA